MGAATASAFAAVVAALWRANRGPSRGMALYADLRAHPGDSADHHPAVPAGVSGVAVEKIVGHDAAAEPRGDFLAGAGAHHHHHHDHVCLLLWSGVWRYSADAANRAGTAAGTGEDQREGGEIAGDKTGRHEDCAGNSSRCAECGPAGREA